MIYFKYSFYVFLVFQCKCWKYIKAAWIKKHIGNQKPMMMVIPNLRQLYMYSSSWNRPPSCFFRFPTLVTYWAGHVSTGPTRGDQVSHGQAQSMEQQSSCLQEAVMGESMWIRSFLQTADSADLNETFLGGCGRLSAMKSKHARHAFVVWLWEPGNIWTLANFCGEQTPNCDQKRFVTLWTHNRLEVSCDVLFPLVGWLIEGFEGLPVYPFNMWMMIDGIPNRPSIFTKRTLLEVSVPWKSNQDPKWKMKEGSRNGWEVSRLEPTN